MVLDEPLQRFRVDGPHDLRCDLHRRRIRVTRVGILSPRRERTRIPPESRIAASFLLVTGDLSESAVEVRSIPGFAIPP